MSTITFTSRDEARTERPTARVQVASTSLVLVLDAPVGAAQAALDRLDLATPLIRALDAVGVADHVALPPTIVDPSPSRLVLGLIWRTGTTATDERVRPDGFAEFAVAGHVTATWDLSVEARHDGTSMLSIAARFTTTDERSCRRLLDAWGIVGAFADVVSQRAATAVKAYVDSLEEELAA
jgi:hypothetical protein